MFGSKRKASNTAADRRIDAVSHRVDLLVAEVGGLTLRASYRSEDIKSLCERQQRCSDVDIGHHHHIEGLQQTSAELGARLFEVEEAARRLDDRLTSIEAIEFLEPASATDADPALFPGELLAPRTSFATIEGRAGCFCSCEHPGLLPRIWRALVG